MIVVIFVFVENKLIFSLSRAYFYVDCMVIFLMNDHCGIRCAVTLSFIHQMLNSPE